MDRRTLLAVGLSFILLVLYQWYMNTVYPPPEPGVQVATESSKEPPGSSGPESIPVTPEAPGEATDVRVGKGPAGPTLETAAASIAPPPARIAESSAKAAVVPFGNKVVSGSLSSAGGRLVDLRFLDYRDKLGPDGAPIRYLDGTPGKQFFVGESGILAAPGLAIPDQTTLWEVASQPEPGSGGELRLTWDNGQGLLFEKILIFNPEGYQFEVRDRVTNRTGQALTVHHFSQLIRSEPGQSEEGGGPPAMDFEGPMGFLNDARVQFKYEELRQGDQLQRSRTGWAGYSDKYFLAAMGGIDSGEERRFYFDYDTPNHRVGMVTPGLVVASGASGEFRARLYVGPKEIRILESQGWHLERSIDYGWFHFLAEPLVKLLLIFNDFMHNFGLAIITLTLLIKLLFFPLANKSYHSMNAMKKLQPKVEQLRKLYGDDRKRLNEEMMKLYQENKVNPLGGCLPIVVQIPVFFALYKVLYLSIEMRHAPFFLWIQDLSAMDPYYVLPVLMGASMFLQTKMNPAPADPIQAKVMLFLPLIFTVMFLTFPSGLVLYWLVNNILSISQQGYIMKKAG
ncbi:MAG: membrane protein insertase YidC [Magnetococcales bacterium]|nr:membrane protein insertase YidC [Magnetococcales bacterium]